MPDNVPDNVRHERRPLVFPIVLIVVGALFLYANYRPGFDAWYVLRTYWPLILIFLGLARIFDSTRARRSGAARMRVQDRRAQRSERFSFSSLYSY